MTVVDLKIRKPTKKKKINFNIYIILSLFFFITVGAIIIVKNSDGWFDPISIIATVAASELKETDGRTNVLLLGMDTRATSDLQTELTDTLLILSVGRVEHDVVLISLPRDLWVQDSRGAKSKINSVYSANKNDLTDDITGGEAITKVVEKVLGVPVHYYATVNFELFKDIINTLGGVEVYVERSFIDYYYPIEGKENAPLSERYETIEFREGSQTMDGETALKFVRSRKGTNQEDTDFARSARQQKIIAAIKDKGLTLNTLLNPNKIKELFELYSQGVDTNLTFSDIQSFYLLSQKINFNRITSIVLDDRSAANEGGLLYAPTDTELYGGAYVLIPKVGDFSQMHAYIQRYLFSAK